MKPFLNFFSSRFLYEEYKKIGVCSFLLGPALFVTIFIQYIIHGYYFVTLQSTISCSYQIFFHRYKWGKLYSYSLDYKMALCNYILIHPRRQFKILAIVIILGLDIELFCQYLLLEAQPSYFLLRMEKLNVPTIVQLYDNTTDNTKIVWQ